MKKLSKPFKRGITLVEVAMTLAIAAIVIAGVILFFQNTSNANNTNKASSQVISIMSTAKSLYSSKTSYAGLSSSILYSAMPADMRRLTGTTKEIIHAFGGTVVLAPGTPNTQAVMTFNAIPQNACLRLASNDFGDEVTNITIDGTTVFSGGRPDLALMDTRCTVATGYVGNIAWTFR